MNTPQILMLSYRKVAAFDPGPGVEHDAMLIDSPPEIVQLSARAMFSHPPGYTWAAATLSVSTDSQVDDPSADGWNGSPKVMEQA
jgi:hypothetical protein